jgi:hypothetical protein
MVEENMTKGDINRKQIIKEAHCGAENVQLKWAANS